MPEITVIIPTYNSEKFIEHTLRSVFNQTFQDFEIIVVDDASTDRTKEIVKKNQLEDKRIRLIELKENSGGPSVPTNIGIQEAKSPFVSLLESDDLYLPNFLEVKLNHMKKNNLDWSIGSAFYLFFNNLRFVKYVKGAPVSTWMMRKDIFERVGYFKKTQNGFQDLGFSLRAVKFKKIKIGLIGEPLTICFIHPQSYTYFLDNVKKKSNIFIKRLESLIEDASGMKDWEALIYQKLGNYYSLSGKLKDGRRYLKLSFKSKPNTIALLLYFLSFFGETLYFVAHKILWFTKNIFFEKIKLLYYIAFKYQKEYLTAKTVLDSFKLHLKNTNAK